MSRSMARHIMDLIHLMAILVLNTSTWNKHGHSVRKVHKAHVKLTVSIIKPHSYGNTTGNGFQLHSFPFANTVTLSPLRTNINTSCIVENMKLKTNQ